MDGKALWKPSRRAKCCRAPAVGEGMVVVRSIDNRIVGFDAKTRREELDRAAHRAGADAAQRARHGRRTASDVIVAQPGGKLVALTWRTARRAGKSRSASRAARPNWSASPTSAACRWWSGGEVCAVAYQGRVGCFDARQRQHPLDQAKCRRSRASPSTSAIVYVADDKGALCALHPRQRHQRLEERQAGLPPPVHAGVVSAARLRWATTRAIVHFLSREDGAFLARAATDGSRDRRDAGGGRLDT